MSILKVEDEKKWINAFVVICAGIVGYIFIRFSLQMGEWFDLESKISHFTKVTHITGVFVGFGFFTFMYKSKSNVKYLTEVYGELVKVVWPNKDATVKLTVGIVIALAIVSGILVLIDYFFRFVLSFIY